MSQPLRLILFDVDGTLVDSQGGIVSAMHTAFGQFDLPAPTRQEMLSLVGISLGPAIARLLPAQTPDMQAQVVQAYKDAYNAYRVQAGSVAGSPLYPGAREMLDQLVALPDTLLGVATGNSQRGLTALLADHGLDAHFVTRQVADHHPSKPHPSMIETALAETGVEAANAVMIGDTSFDMDMARAAGVPGIGVSWGYHSPAALSSAVRIIDHFDALPRVLEDIWKVRL